MTLLQVEHVMLTTADTEWWIGGGIFGLYGLIVLFLARHWKGQEDKLVRMERAWGFALLALLVIKHINLLAIGQWNVYDNLELHLCGFSRMMSILLLAFGLRWAFYPLFFWGIVGGIHSLLTPELTSGGSPFMFFEYYVIHGGIIIIPLYFVFARNYMVGRWTWVKILGVNLAMMPPIYAINRIIGEGANGLKANYQFLIDPPAVENIFIQGEWPWYLLNFIVVGALHYIVLTAIFWGRIRRAEKAAA